MPRAADFIRVKIDAALRARALAEEFADQLNKLPQWGQLKPLLAAKPIPRAQVVAALARAWRGCATFVEVAKRDVMSEFSA
jgi:hypothetical protein